MRYKLRHVHHNVIPHLHEDGAEHSAHALSVFALFGYLAVFVVVIAGFGVIRVTAPQILGAVTFSADQIISLTNVKRSENGLGQVTANQLLAQAAAAKAANMFSENYWAHNSPSGKTPWTFIQAAGYKYVYAGENLARDFADAQSVVNAWMNSPSHKSNLLDKNFKEIGVAVASGTLTGQEGILVVQMFGSGISQIPAPLAQASPSPVAVASPTSQAVAGNVASPKPSPTPSPAESPTPTPTQAPVVAQADLLVPVPSEQPGSEVTVLASRQFSISKIISLALVGFVFLLFVTEVVMVSRREHLHLRSGLLAHLGILAFLLFLIWYAVGGAVL